MNSPLNDLFKVSGVIFNIQRCCLQDGPGIRTTLFLKGCPLRCEWCHNPESLSFFPEIGYTAASCLSCGACASVCPAGSHRMEEGRHIFDRTNCTACGRCVSVCPGALDFFGKRVTVEEAFREVRADMPFYGEKGGVTLSGGEPFAQPEFSLALLQKAKEEGIGTCVETSGYCKNEVLKRALPYVDIFLFDYKAATAEKHRQFTGQDNALILQNLSFLNSQKAKIILRCPIIPGYHDNEEHLLGIAAAANAFSSVVGIELEPGHTIGNSKIAQMGYDRKILSFDPPKEDRIAEMITFLKKHTGKEVRKA